MVEITKLDLTAIKRILPHRGRALMLDRAEIVGNQVTGYFVVTKEVCEGHLPDIPIFRGTDRLEVLFLTMGVGAGLPKGKIPVAAKAEEIKWPGIVVPGQEVRAEVTIERLRSRTVTGSGILYLGDRVVCVAKRITGRIVSASEFK